MLHRPPSVQRPADRKAKLRRERNRRWRKRLREGRMTFTGEIDDVGVQWLVTCGYLTECEASDARTLRDRVGQAVTMLLRLSSR